MNQHRLEGQGGVEEPLADRLREAKEVLSSVVLPGYDVEIISAGLVERIRVGFDGKSVMVVLGYSRVVISAVASAAS